VPKKFIDILIKEKPAYMDIGNNQYGKAIYIFNKAKAHSAFSISLLALFVLVSYLAYVSISNPYLVVFIIFLFSGATIWLSFYLDR
jgi:hypothetical protein